MTTLSSQRDQCKPAAEQLPVTEGAGQICPNAWCAELEGPARDKSLPIQSFEHRVTKKDMLAAVALKGGNINEAITQETSKMQLALSEKLAEMLAKLPDSMRSDAEVYFTNVLGEVAPNLIVYGLAQVNAERTEEYPVSDKDLLHSGGLRNIAVKLTAAQKAYYEQRAANLPAILRACLDKTDDSAYVSCRFDVYADRFEVRAKDPQGFPKFEEKLAHAMDCGQDNWINVAGGRGLTVLFLYCTDMYRDPNDSSAIVFSKEFGKPRLAERLYALED